MLADMVDRILERFSLRFCLARLMTGPQDWNGWAVEIESDVPLNEIGEGKAILLWRRAVVLA
jgi:hypothetical protein